MSGKVGEQHRRLGSGAVRIIPDFDTAKLHAPRKAAWRKAFGDFAETGVYLARLPRTYLQGEIYVHKWP